MKKAFFLFLSLFFILDTAFAQTLYIEYEMSLQLGEAAQNLPADLVKKMNNMVIDFKYAHSGNKSVYSYVQQRAKDPNIPKMQSSGEVAIVIHKDLNNKVIYQSSESLPGSVSKEPLLCEQRWKIKKEIKMIAGHNCQKATTFDNTGSIITAWYALDIAVSDGPDRYCGLPGMILRIEAESYIIQATRVRLNEQNQDGMDIVMPRADQYISYDNFRELVKKRH